ncbi:tyrosine-type recombinase/integrase [Alkalicoccus luteus]|uniref:tyrosine-type recombinase/integrase n=1 Tax=Alkalicoccus luteus TaxID=1237094 RepID=UPI0040345B83
MEFVDPIVSVNHINQMKLHLKKQSLRDYALFSVGINTGLRISDLLNIKVDNIQNQSGGIKDSYSLLKKNNRINYVYLNNQARTAISSYIESASIHPHDFLFKSPRSNSPLSRQQAYRIIHQAASEVGIPGNIGTHTLRKTFGYHAYKKGVSIAIIQKLFDHSSKYETYHYLGIDPSNDHFIKIDVNL